MDSNTRSEMFQKQYIGEVLLEDASALMKEQSKVNMMQLLGDMKNKKRQCNVSSYRYKKKERNYASRKIRDFRILIKKTCKARER